MSTNPIPQEDTARMLMRQADEAMRDNPLPALLTAAALGFAVGVIIRALQPDPHPVRDYLEETGGQVRSFLRPFGQKARQAYSVSSEAMREAAEKVQEPGAKTLHSWWQRLWE